MPNQVAAGMDGNNLNSVLSWAQQLSSDSQAKAEASMALQEGFSQSIVELSKAMREVAEALRGISYVMRKDHEHGT